jgi:formylglycine-generating enzyme required for sulfatase activity
LSLEIVVNDAAGTRVLSEQDLPLHIGTSPESDIRVPGAVANTVIAQIGLLDQRAFVQVPGKGSVTVNGEQVSTTRWLQPDDELLVGGVGIRCDVSVDKFEIRVDYRDIEYQTAPPLLDADSAAADSSITPQRTRRPISQPQQLTGGGKRGWYAVYAGLAVLLLAAAYMFSSVTVVISAAQGNAAVSLPDSLLTPGANGRYLLWPGTYSVHIEAPGFQSLDEEIEVNAGERAEFEFALQELPGRLQVSTVPETTGQVWIDGKAVGELPTSEIQLDKGNYELRIRTPRFLEHITTVEVLGQDQLQAITAELVPNWADIVLNTEPPGAEVFVADELLGVTPATVQLVAGSQEIVLRKPGYRTEQRTLSVVAGQSEELPLISLAEAGGFLNISSQPSGAAVTVENEFRGNTPLEIEVAKGRSYQVRLSRAGYQTATRSVQVSDGVPVPVEVRMQPKLGKISISASPADASLYVDGRSLGNASQELELLAVPHTLEIRKAGYDTWVAQVTPKPGLPQRLDVVLLTPEQKVLAAIPKTLTTSQDQVLQLVQPGELTLGAERREQGRRPNEVRRSVRLTRLFYIGREEVSNREFRAFKPRHTSGAEKYRELAADGHPAVMLSWDDAAAYCNWLSQQDGLTPAYIRDRKKLLLADPPTNGYRMPTEAEWAWVARYGGGTGAGPQKYPWGSVMPPPNNSGNFADMAAEDVAANTINGFNDGYPVTSPGAAFAPNAIGIYDLGGNVAEWVNDYYSVAANTPGVLIDPVGPTSGQYHVIRGSSWRQASISELRLAYRDFGDRGRLDVGFRLARYAENYADKGN